MKCEDISVVFVIHCLLYNAQFIVFCAVCNDKCKVGGVNCAVCSVL